MVAHNGRRGQAVSVPFVDTLNGLNVVSEPSPEDTNYDDGLEMFTHQEFVDWNPQLPPELREPGKADTSKANTSMTGPTTPAIGEMPNIDFPLHDDFGNFDFGTFSHPTGVTNFSDSLGNLPSLQPNHGYPQSGAHQPSYAVPPPQSATKRLSDASHHRQVSLEEQSRLAAEEDKRRRNTAASARFRVKKKAREQALEKREKELNDEVSSMKSRITHLETENKWLRGLVMEKTGAKDSKFDAKISAFLNSVNSMSRESDSESEAEKKKAKAEESAK